MVNANLARLWASCLGALIGVCLPACLFAQAPSGKSITPASGSPAAALPPAVKRAAALFDRAVSLQKAGKVDAALATYREFLGQAKTAGLNANALLLAYRNMLNLYRYRADTQNQEITLKQIVALRPDDAASWAALAVIESGKRDYPAAYADAQRALQLKPPAAAAASAHFALGFVAIGKNDYTRGAEEFGQAARLAPANAGGHYYYAISLSRQKRYPQALVEAEKARQIAPKMVQVPLLIATLKQETNDLPGALAAYKEALALDPHNRLALFNRALMLHKMGKVKEAITAYLAMEAVYPQDADTQLNLGILYATLHDDTTARRHFLIGVVALKKSGSHDVRGLEYLAEAEMQLALDTADTTRREEMVKQSASHLRKAQALDPNNTRLLYQLAELYRRTGHYEDALAIYRQRITAAPDEKAAYFGLSDVYVMQARQQDAIDIWRAYRKRKPDDPLSYQQCARFLELEGKWADAAKEYDQFLQIDPRDGNAILAQANDYVQAGQADKAEPLYKQLLTFDVTAADKPVSVRPGAIGDRQSWRLAAWRGLANIEQQRDHISDAIADLEHAKSEEAAQDKKLGLPPKPDVYLQIAGLYERVKQPDKAGDELIELTHAAPDDPTGFAELGHLYERQGKTDEAVSALRKASQRDKDPLRYGLEAAELYRRHGKLDQAIAEYQELQRKFPKEVRVLSPLAQALETAGRNDAAITVYTSLIQADPSLLWVEDRKAAVLTRLKRYDEARALRAKMIERNPDNPQNYADLSHIYTLQGQSPAYLAWLQARAAKRPDNAALLSALLDEYIQQKRQDEGWTYLQRLVDSHQKERAVLQAYVFVLDRHGRSSDTPAILQRIAALDPNDIGAQIDYADSLAANGQYQQAIKTFQAQIARTDLPLPSRMELRRQLAQRLEAQGDAAGAISQYQEIVSAQPQDISSLTALIRLFNTANRYNDIITTCNNLLKRQDNPPLLRAQLLSYLGAAYEKQNNRAEAVIQYREAIKANPADPEASAALKRLGG